MIQNFDEKAEEFLDSSNIIFITGEIDDEMYRYAVSKIIYYAAENTNPIYLIINSIGGSVYSAYGIISVMKSVNNEIVGVANGIVASAALVLLANCDYRYAFKGSSFMHHLPSTSVEGTDIDIEHMIEELNVIKNHEFFKKAEELTPSNVDLTRNVDYTFTIDQAKSSGLIQKVIENFDDIVPEKYAEELKASMIEEIVNSIFSIYEEYEDIELFSVALDLAKEVIAKNVEFDEKSVNEKSKKK